MLSASQKRIDERAVKTSKRHRSSEGEMVLAVFAAFDKKVPWARGYQRSSKYILSHLEYDSPYAYRLNTVLKNLRRFPSLRKAMLTGRMEIDKATKLVAHLTDANAERLVEFACTNTYAAMVEHITGKAAPKKTRETVKQLSEDQFAIRIVVTRAQFEQIKRVQSLEAQRQRPHRMGDAIAVALATHLKRHDPVTKADRQTPTAYSRAETSGRAPLRATERNEVLRRTRGRCTNVDAEGVHCTEDRWIQFHHLKPVAEGGQNDPDNLTTLCAAHHAMHHRGGGP